MRKLTIKLGTVDNTLTIPIGGANNLLGYDDSLEALIENETSASVNDVSDLETRRILPLNNANIQFYFWNGFTYVNTVAPMEFAASAYSTTAAKTSFYVVQLFDNFNDENQKKLHTGYYNGFDFARNSLSANYQYNSTIEFSNFYLSESYLDSLTGITKVYAKFIFYSAKSGKFYPFFNYNDHTLNTQQQLYHTILLNPSARTYSFASNYNPIVVRELVNAQYSAFINNTVSSFSLKKPVYPSGNTFTNDGVYITQ